MATNVNRSSGNTVVEVPGMDLDPEDCAGWLQVKIGKKNETIEAKPNARTAHQVSARATRAARMLGILPKEETKIIVRSRGGLDLARTPVANVISAIRKAANLLPAETVLDTQCPNVQQDIMVISTPDELRARRYAIKEITIGTKKYEVGAYCGGPARNGEGSRRRHATRRLGKHNQRKRPKPKKSTGTSGTTHRYVHHNHRSVRRTQGTALRVLRRRSVEMHPLPQTFDVCRTCGKVGHRTDVSPTPESKTCLGCSKEASQDHQCNPKCKLCGGPHLTGDKDCRTNSRCHTSSATDSGTGKFWREPKKRGRSSRQNHRELPAAARPHPCSRTSSRASSRSRSRSAGGKVTWAQMARLESAEMKALKEANKQQARKIAEQEDTIKRMAADMATMKNMMMQMAGKTNKPAPAEEETKTPPAKRRSTETSRTQTPEEKQHTLELNERTDKIEEGCRQMESRINASNGGEHKRGVCTFVRRGITTLTHDYKGDPNAERRMTELIIGKESLYLVNVYNSLRYGKQCFKHLQHSNTRLADDRTLVIAGDFNAQHTGTGHAATKPKGKNLIQDATEEDLQLITDPRYPTLPARNTASRDTTPDLAFANEEEGETAATGGGKGPTIQDYCAMLEQVAKMGNWTDGKRFGMAKCGMIGAAYDFARRDEKVKLAESSSEFKRLALAYFDTDPPPSVRLTRFLEAQQRPEALGYDTLSKNDEGRAERAKYAKEFLYKQMRSQFVSSLRDPVCWYVLFKNPVMFEAAVEAAVHEEHNKSLTAREERMHIVAAEVQPENREIAQLTETLDRLEHLLSQQTKHECRATSAQQLPIRGESDARQPLGVAINRPFKDRLREDHQLTPTGRIKRASLGQVASWIAARGDDIPAKPIVKLFQKCCILNALDGTDDHALWEVDSDKDTSEDDE
ncbi:hypothetical protein HPB47_004057 [Ixodes persulcatus]|uniref:Uncharacterized protein n=1 Tax=Ixodes persulcatus TaxID=34615 RepID=A0AC60PGT4_IXOPE|nr:hypothetical protein HPB47_004057 [Ixodes persulcatus]